MQVHCISVSEHIWVGGCGLRGVGELPAGGIRASQGTFSSILDGIIKLISDSRYAGPSAKISSYPDGAPDSEDQTPGGRGRAGYCSTAPSFRGG